MPYMRLYRTKNKESSSLRTDDIMGAKPRRAVRDRDPEAFNKMNQIQKLQQNVNVEPSDPMRKTSKNLDHYHRMMSNLPGGVARWEGMYNAPKGNSAGVKDALTHYEKSDGQVPSPKKDTQYVKAPYFRDEHPDLHMAGAVRPRDQPQNRVDGSLDAKRFAAESSLGGLRGPDRRPFGQPNNQDFGISPEKLPSLPHPTRFRSPQPLKGKDNHDMGLLLAHQ